MHFWKWPKEPGYEHYSELLRISEKSSTKMIRPIKWTGDRSNTEWTVRSNTDHASLWKQIITSVDGKSSKKRPPSLHLRNRDQILFLFIFQSPRCDDSFTIDLVYPEDFDESISSRMRIDWRHFSSIHHQRLFSFPPTFSLVEQRAFPFHLARPDDSVLARASLQFHWKINVKAVQK